MGLNHNQGKVCALSLYFHSLLPDSCPFKPDTSKKEIHPWIYYTYLLFSSTNVQSITVGVTIQWVPVTLIHWLKISLAAHSNIPRLRLSVHLLNKWFRFKKALLGLQIGRWFAVFFIVYILFLIKSHPLLPQFLSCTVINWKSLYWLYLHLQLCQQHVVLQDKFTILFYISIYCNRTNR